MDTSKKKKLKGSTEDTTKPTAVQGSFKVSANKRQLLIIGAAIVIVLAIGGYMTYRHYHQPKPTVPDAGYQENIEQIKNTRPADNASAEEKANYYATLGAAYSAAGNNKETIKALEQADALTTQPAAKYGIWYNLAGAYKTDGDKKKAIEYYQKALDFAKHPPEGEPIDEDLVKDLNQKINKLGG